MSLIQRNHHRVRRKHHRHTADGHCAGNGHRDVPDDEKVEIPDTGFASDVYGTLSHACVELIEPNVVHIVDGAGKCAKQMPPVQQCLKLDGRLG
jgi:hypothetical protein